MHGTAKILTSSPAALEALRRAQRQENLTPEQTARRARTLGLVLPATFFARTSQDPVGGVVMGPKRFAAAAGGAPPGATARHATLANAFVAKASAVGAQPAPACPPETVSLKNLLAADPELGAAILEQYHAGLVRAYPGKGKVESVEVFRRNLERTDIDWDVIVFYDRDKMVGGAQTRVFSVRGRTFGGIDQAWAARGVERETAVAAFEDACLRMREAGASIVFSEINDPHLMSRSQKRQDAGRSPFRADSAAFMGGPRSGPQRGLGFVQPDAKYIQPTLNHGGAPVRHLSLGLRSYDRAIQETIPRQVWLDLLTGYFASFAIFQDRAAAEATTPAALVAHDPSYKEIVASVRRDAIPLRPLGARRGFIARQA